MFEKLESFTKDVSDLADRPALSSTELKNQFDAAPNEVREYLNKLIDALKKTESGDSGAKNIGVTTISGLTGNDVQSLLESLKTLSDKKPTSPEGTGFLIQRATASLFTNGSSNSATAHVTFGTPFTQQPWVMPANITQAQPYSDSILYPYIYNVTATGFDVKIMAADGANLGTMGSPANIFMNFVAFGI